MEKELLKLQGMLLKAYATISETCPKSPERDSALHKIQREIGRVEGMLEIYSKPWYKRVWRVLR